MRWKKQGVDQIESKQEGRVLRGVKAEGIEHSLREKASVREEEDDLSLHIDERGSESRERWSEGLL